MEYIPKPIEYTYTPVYVAKPVEYTYTPSPTPIVDVTPVYDWTPPIILDLGPASDYTSESSIYEAC
jgi:hypothetical protein